MDGSISGYWLWASLLAAVVCMYLAFSAGTSDWVMDADESVHAIEGLRRFDALVNESFPDFLARVYFPERWQPPVQDHVRWYGSVHSLSLLPSYALLGLNEEAARVPSVVWLALAWYGLLKLTHRIAPRNKDQAVLATSLLLASCPNLLTFAPQCLTETASLATAVMAVLFYLRWLDRPGDTWRTVQGGLALGLAILTKYDHGLILLTGLAVAELVRAHFSPRAWLRSRAWLLFAVAGCLFGAWIAHPDKWAAFQDTLAHSPMDSARVVALNALTSLALEITSSPLVAALVILALCVAPRASRDPALRVVWIYAAFSTLVLLYRGRFQFRFHYVETPFALVLTGALTPLGIEELMRGLDPRRPAARSPLARVGFLVVGLTGVATLVLLVWHAVDPSAWQRAMKASVSFGFQRLAQLLTFQHQPSFYAQPLALGLEAGVRILWAGLAGSALALVGAAWLYLRPPDWFQRNPRALPAAAVSLALCACIPGGLDFARTLPKRLRFEYEGLPQLRAVMEFCRREAAGLRLVLFAGGFDQLTNNTLRFDLLCRPERDPLPFDQVQVVGDMIGSGILPAGPRIAHWTGVLREGPEESQPDLIFILVPGPDFLYRWDMLRSAEHYRQAIRERGGWVRTSVREFPAVGCQVEIWKRDAGSPLGAPVPREFDVQAMSMEVDRVGAGGLLMADESWRHLRNPFLFPERAESLP